ncbi:MAG: hypothetical protein QXO32_01210 [Candidatus Bathyarchaeia archaeon]
MPKVPLKLRQGLVYNWLVHEFGVTVKLYEVDREFKGPLYARRILSKLVEESGRMGEAKRP